MLNPEKLLLESGKRKGSIANAADKKCSQDPHQGQFMEEIRARVNWNLRTERWLHQQRAPNTQNQTEGAWLWYRQQYPQIQRQEFGKEKQKHPLHLCQPYRLCFPRKGIFRFCFRGSYYKRTRYGIWCLSWEDYCMSISCTVAFFVEVTPRTGYCDSKCSEAALYSLSSHTGAR